ncbi:MAG: hypothetical protein ACRC40_04720 [Fusobacteriaceae bacterium]
MNVLEREQLNLKLRDVKEDLSENNSKSLLEMIEPSLKNNHISSQIKNLNFQRVKIFFSQPEFQGSLANNIIAFNFSDTTFYMELKYEFKDGIWQITDMKEKRR